MPEPESKKRECPECGVDMTGRDPIGHANDHWDPRVRDEELGAEAARRRKILRGM